MSIVSLSRKNLIAVKTSHKSTISKSENFKDIDINASFQANDKSYLWQHVYTTASESCVDLLYKQHAKCPFNVLLTYININSIRNKFDDLKLLLGEYVDILAIAETKIDSTFPLNQFIIKDFHKPYRLDINKRSGGILIFIKQHLTTKLLIKHTFPQDVQAIPFEINLEKEKWLFVAIYKPPSQSNIYFLII